MDRAALFPGLMVETCAVRTRDGVSLATDVYRPAAGGPFPTLVTRTPYGRLNASAAVLAHPAWYARHGYAVVVQDVRGRGGSEGTFYPFRHEGADGYDAVEWAAAQPWSNGRVGLYGFSYAGVAALLAAAEQPPHLVAVAPAGAASDCYHTWFYRGGAFCLQNIQTWALQLARDEARRYGRRDEEARIAAALAAGPAAHGMLPVGAFPPLAGEAGAFYQDWTRHVTAGGYWEAFNLEASHERLSRYPMLHAAGWFDPILDGTLRNYRGLRDLGRAPQYLLVGPWLHLPWSRYQAEQDFGPEADSPLDQLLVRWWDRWLRGAPPDDGEPVRVFDVTARRWRSVTDWPPPGSRPLTLFLHSAGRARSMGGDGSLSQEPPREDEPPDLFLHDPRQPVPAPSPVLGDLRPAEARNDVLCYTTPPLPRPVVLAGPVACELWTATTGLDADWVVKLAQVTPAGPVRCLSYGVLRARYRTSFQEPRLLTPGCPERVVIRLRDVAATIPARHALRLEVAGSCFPLLDRNPSTGVEPSQAQVWDLTPAQQAVLHDAARPSRVTLTVLP
ncbi:MAG TPA: CocE/NonD family hydrolase [Dehalococcoidia bacterium]